ncbi:MAG TPA: hypothetical protein GXZ82_04100 [Firmicutes bacterium]|nr:hypothetical protein [Bacillota bacterium]
MCHNRWCFVFLLCFVVCAQVAAQQPTPGEVWYEDDFERTAQIYRISGALSTPGETWQVTSGSAFIIEEGIGRTISEAHEGLLGPDSPFPFNRAYESYKSSASTFGEAGNPATNGQAPQNVFRVHNPEWKTYGDFAVETRFRATKIRWRPGISGGFGVSLLLNWNSAEFPTSYDYRDWYVVQLRFVEANRTWQIARMSVHAYRAGLPSSANYFNPIPGRYIDTPGLPGMAENTWYTVRVEVREKTDMLELMIWCKTDEDADWRYIGTVYDNGRLSLIYQGKAYFAGPVNNAGVVSLRSDYADVEFDYVRVEKL